MIQSWSGWPVSPVIAQQTLDSALLSSASFVSALQFNSWIINQENRETLHLSVSKIFKTLYFLHKSKKKHFPFRRNIIDTIVLIQWAVDKQSENNDFLVYFLCHPSGYLIIFMVCSKELSALLSVKIN